MDNINIFQSKTLPAKVVAVYPIALYRNDPLPKHICKKCHWSTQNMYNEMEKAMRNQSKWIANIRLAQPENQYLKVVDSIAGANKQTSQLVSLIAGSEIGERTISKLFNFDLDQPSPPIKCPTTPEIKPSPESIKTDENPDTSGGAAELDLQVKSQKSTNPPKPPETKITQLQSVLELNGCTLTKVKPAAAKPSTSNKQTASPKTKTEVAPEIIGIDIKEELLDDGYHLTVQIEQPKPTAEHNVKCKLCSFSCETVEEVAIHQLEHLSISATKLSERRILSKRSRRGRLIMIEEKKCIRCLNCWRIFADNKSILQHWSEGDCDFFCQICGKEFASSPKMLREHIPAAHGISYRSSKILRPPTLVPSKSMKTEKSPVKVKTMSSTVTPTKIEPELIKVKAPQNRKKSGRPPPNGSLTVKVACNICLKVFANFKARNSHMRAHKHPPFLPALPPPPLKEALMARNRSDLLQIKDEPLDSNPFQEIIPQAPPIAPATNRPGPAFTKINPAAKHPRLKVIPSRTSAGVRKKHTPFIRRPVAVKTEPELMSPCAEIMTVKSVVDLQDPCVSSQLPEESEKLFFDDTATTATPPLMTPTPTPSPKLTSTSTSTSNGVPVSINGLSFDFGLPPKDNMNYGQVFTCHPCGLKFNSKLELFRHKRKCSANNLFPCQFCEKHFVTSADLQMHIMLLHKSSGNQ